MNGHTLLLLVAMITLPLLVSSCGETEQTTQTERTIAVNVQTVTPSDETLVRTFTGSLEGEKQAILYAKLAESVREVKAREGESVKADQVIVSLDKDGPSTRYNEVRSLFLNAEKNFGKMEALYKEGAISETQFDGARTQFEVAQANYESVSRLVDIRTPIAGTLTSVLVRPGDFVALGQQLAVVATPGRLRVIFAVNTENVRFVRQGADVRIVSDVVADTLTGRITSIAESADPATRSFQVEAVIDNRASAYHPGMFVSIQVVEQELPDVLAVPRGAILKLDNKNVGFVVVNGVAKRREVTLGPELDGRVVVLSGLQSGDTLVTLGQSYLDEGFKVTISASLEG
ncbi:MAG: efflux RND transporter periplasmic adaptor subunit [candidate division Zixibacteria bacterium]|nr:efflux RND transporter periplasmic adaptor subunit [candidate division Zixibacteria bacterium]